jgi:hypothetical protein
MKLCYGVLGCVIVLSSLAFGAVPAEDASSKKFSSPSAQAAQKAYMQALEKAWQQYRVLADKAIQDYQLALRAAYKKEVEADNLKEALSIKEEIRRFSFDLKKGLVLYFPFDKPAVGGKTPDMSGSNNHGKVEGAVWTADGAVGGAYQFDINRKKDRIVVADSNSLDSKMITISVWVKTDDNDEHWNRIIDKNWKRGFSLAMGGDSQGKQYRGKVGFEAGEGAFVLSDNPISDNKWHHVVARHDGEMMTVFIDGIKQKAQHKMNKGIPLNNYNIGIGNEHPGYNDVVEFLAFNGLIDELRVYNRPLSEKEIAALYGQRK